MKLSSASSLLAVAAAFVPPTAAEPEFGELPPGLTTDGALAAWKQFVENAFPTWCIDENENRLTPEEMPECDGTVNGRWDPLYLTKWHGGKDPSMGGYPTDVDTRYPFYYASGFFGQACAGGNAHCSFDFNGGKHGCHKCGKIVTEDDNGANGPGHVPPHIGLAALTRAYHDGGFGDVKTWFDPTHNGCRVLPSALLPMIRKYFPRPEGGVGEVKYPPPFTTDGGPGMPDGTTYQYPLEFVNLVGDSCAKEQEKFPSAECYEQHSDGTADDFPSYLKPGHGSPHYCSVEAMAAGVNKDWCPYVYFGPHRGRYRHPHIAFAAVEVWLAHKAGIEGCGATWDDNDGKDYPFVPDHSIAFPAMTSVAGHEDHPKQPTIKDDGGFVWPGDEGTKRKAVSGVFVLDKYLTPTTFEDPLVSADMVEAAKEVKCPEIVSTNGDHSSTNGDYSSTNGDHSHSSASADDASVETQARTKDENSAYGKRGGGLLVLSVAAFLFAI